MPILIFQKNMKKSAFRLCGIGLRFYKTNTIFQGRTGREKNQVFNLTIVLLPPADSRENSEESSRMQGHCKGAHEVFGQWSVIERNEGTSFPISLHSNIAIITSSSHTAMRDIRIALCETFESPYLNTLDRLI